MYSDRRGNGQKPLGQNLPDKRPPDRTPGQKPPRTIEREFVQGAFVRDFCTRLTKNGGSEMCDVLWGVPGCVTKCGRGRGSKLAKNSVTYFMDGPKASRSDLKLSCMHYRCNYLVFTCIKALIICHYYSQERVILSIYSCLKQVGNEQHWAYLGGLRIPTPKLNFVAVKERNLQIEFKHPRKSQSSAKNFPGYAPVNTAMFQKFTSDKLP